jgi:cellulose biosynthesis protein BcsQ
LDKTLFDTLVNEEPLFILPSLHGMALAPTNITLSAAEIQLVNLDFREVRLSEALDPIRDDYDFILIDCPPSLGSLELQRFGGSHSRSRSDRDTLQSLPGYQLTLANGG